MTNICVTSTDQAVQILEKLEEDGIGKTKVGILCFDYMQARDVVIAWIESRSQYRRVDENEQLYCDTMCLQVKALKTSDVRKGKGWKPDLYIVVKTQGFDAREALGC